MCGERFGAKWLPLHQPGGCCTLVVVEADFPLITECKHYINAIFLCTHFSSSAPFTLMQIVLWTTISTDTQESQTKPRGSPSGILLERFSTLANASQCGY